MAEKETGIEPHHDLRCAKSAIHRAMVSRSKLTLEALTKLGARKLAEVLLTEAAGNRQLKQTLNQAVSANEGPTALHAILRKRLITLAYSTLPSVRARCGAT